ncbi:unnamed protein product [Phytophthora lilii]|uniref:Unnamed protein product n=1 Tax=Phytophthora lilii TaxID=2077276 RepID=A0A9W6TE69_9STRA|nr:unnamed protein product [Phytophthora lilii]
MLNHFHVISTNPAVINVELLPTRFKHWVFSFFDVIAIEDTDQIGKMSFDKVLSDEAYFLPRAILLFDPVIQFDLTLIKDA